jgi:integrase
MSKQMTNELAEVGPLPDRPKSLTPTGVKAKKEVGYYPDYGHPGLYLQVRHGTKAHKADDGIRRSWIFRYKSPLTGKRRDMGLGPTDKQSLAGARELARKLWAQVLDKENPKDPIEEARKKALAAALEKSKAITFDKATELYIQTMRPEWRNPKHIAQWENTLRTYASPVIGKIPVQQIDADLVLQVLEPIWQSKTETATRIRQRIEAVFDYCKARKYFKGENPAKWKGNLKDMLSNPNKIKDVQNHPALHYTKIHAFITELRTKGGVAPLALEFLILTAARTGEVIGARFDEVNFDARLWTRPAARMKAGKEHSVPLNDRAMEILRALRETATSDYIFPGWKANVDSGLSNGAMLAVMKGMGDFKEYVPHGFRSTFTDWANETTKHPNVVIEMALAHTIKNETEKAYRRGELIEKRTRLMNEWGKYIETPAKPAKVIDLKERAA